jgi:uncharacterized protein
MIPQFPNFKKIEVNDKVRIERYTHLYFPYSTFNFTNFWAWDVKCDRMVSDLNGNLVIRFIDSKSSEPFLSFLGGNSIEETVIQLIKFAQASGISTVLRFLKDDSIARLKSSNFHIEEDRGNFDYVFSTCSIANPIGSRYKEKRQRARRFLREYPGAHLETLELNNLNAQEQILEVFRRWAINKKLDNKEFDLTREELALNRLLKNAHCHKLIVSCVFWRGFMHGFSVDEIVSQGYAMAHFVKADKTFKGIYEFMNERIAQDLQSHGVELWNWQQDLDLAGLRASKLSYHPVAFFKSYKLFSSL